MKYTLIMSILYIMNKCGITVVHFCMYVLTYVPATHTAHQAVWFGLLSPEVGGQRGGVREHPRATGGHLGCSAVEGHMHGLCGSMSGCVDVRSGCVGV